MSVGLTYRKVAYRLYPSKAQAQSLFGILAMHQSLYNAALEQRIDAWRRKGISLSFYDQRQELTALRRECPEFAAINCSSQQVTLRRLDHAFKAFFRRLKERRGQAGFPRFKSVEGFQTFAYVQHGNGWKFVPGADWKHGKLRISGVGVIKARGQARTGGKVKSCDLRCRGGEWDLLVTVECAPFRQGGQEACGLDWGLETFSTLALPDGRSDQIPNPRLGRNAGRDIRIASRALSRKAKGGANRRKALKRLQRLSRRLASRRRDFLHKTSAGLVGRFALIATEDLNIESMTASARGTLAKPGRNVKAKAGLNREILDTAPGAFLAHLRYKACEAGSEFVEAPTRKLKPSQTCPACGRVEKKKLSQRMHCCPCGHVESRDAAAGRVALNWALAQMRSGREPALRETSAGIASPAHEAPKGAVHTNAPRVQP